MLLFLRCFLLLLPCFWHSVYIDTVVFTVSPPLLTADIKVFTISPFCSCDDSGILGCRCRCFYNVSRWFDIVLALLSVGTVVFHSDSRCFTMILAFRNADAGVFRLILAPSLLQWFLMCSSRFWHT